MKTSKELAQSAGFEVYKDKIVWDDINCANEVDRLIELARADERTICAKICNDRAIGWDAASKPRDNIQAMMQLSAKNEARALYAAILQR